ncbi:MAG: glycosyltransferase [Alphaproteobacteria bacterium]|nr:glycosyltransferase [Alphaproteobacteria bacterium]
MVEAHPGPPTPQAARLRSIWEALDIGDLDVAWRRYLAVPTAEQGLPPFHLVRAALLFSSDRLDEASEVIDDFCGRWPDDPDGIEWAIKIHQIAGAVERGQRIRALSERAGQLIAARVKVWLASSSGGLIPLLERIVTDPGISNAYRARIVDMLFNAEQLDGRAKANIFAALDVRSHDWPPDGRLFWASLLLLFSDRPEDAIRRINGLLESDAVATGSFAALQFTVNRAVGTGNMAVFRSRYDLLTALHERWLERIAAAMRTSERSRLAQATYPAARSGRIAILTSPLISHLHAPTMRVLELAAALIGMHGYEVRIFAGGPTFFRPTAPVAIVNIYNAQADKLLVPTLRFDGVEIGISGNLLDDGQALKAPLTASEILEFGPDAVIAYGDASPVQGLLAGRAPLLLIPTGSGPPVGALDRFASEWNEAALRDRVEEGTWPARLAERAVFGATGVRVPGPVSPKRREEIQPDASSVLAIAGTRLEEELRGVFAKRLADFLDARPTVHLILVGGGRRDALLGPELRPVADRVATLDYAMDLAGLFCGCDVVLNPDRQGGGTAIAMAMAVGCPVVSLTAGDAATLLDREDLSEDLDAYFDRLARLIDDDSFRRDVAARMAVQVERMLGFERGVATVARTVEELAAEFRAGTLPPPVGAALHAARSDRPDQ